MSCGDTAVIWGLNWWVPDERVGSPRSSPMRGLRSNPWENENGKNEKNKRFSLNSLYFMYAINQFFSRFSHFYFLMEQLFKATWNSKFLCFNTWELQYFPKLWTVGPTLLPVRIHIQRSNRLSTHSRMYMHVWWWIHHSNNVEPYRSTTVSKIRDPVGDPLWFHLIY